MDVRIALKNEVIFWVIDLMPFPNIPIYSQKFPNICTI